MMGWIDEVIDDMTMGWDGVSDDDDDDILVCCCSEDGG